MIIKDNLIEVLSKMDNIIAKELLSSSFNVEKFNIESISLSSELGMISYEESSGRKLRTRAGRLLRKIFDGRFTISELEIFSNEYKSLQTIDYSNIEVVSGDDIKYWYNEENYYGYCGDEQEESIGSLWKSCMRYQSPECFQLYIDLGAKMVILKDGQELVARAILWDDVLMGEEKIKLMDRIYYIRDHQVDILKRWASDNGYAYKTTQSHDSMTEITLNGECVTRELSITTEIENEYRRVPYLDTFRYADNKVFSNEIFERAIAKFDDPDGYPRGLSVFIDDVNGNLYESNERIVLYNGMSISCEAHSTLKLSDGTYCLSSEAIICEDGNVELKEHVNYFNGAPYSRASTIIEVDGRFMVVGPNYIWSWFCRESIKMSDSVTCNITGSLINIKNSSYYTGNYCHENLLFIKEQSTPEAFSKVLSKVFNGEIYEKEINEISKRIRERNTPDKAEYSFIKGIIESSNII